MLQPSVERRIQKTLLFGSALVTLAVTPTLNFDPINLVKLSLISLTACMSVGMLLIATKFRFERRFRIPAATAGIFFVSAWLVFVINGAETFSFYGIFGRNTGLLTYINLSFIFLTSVIVGTKFFVRNVLSALYWVALINASYGLIQFFGLDPLDWANPYNPIVGSLGNPNFVASLLGLGGIVAFSLLIESSSWATRLRHLFAISLFIFVAIGSDSIQGIGVFGVGVVILLYFRFIQPRELILKLSFLLITLAGAITVLLGILQQGPLKAALYQDSVSYRGDYWRAGWNMTTENLFSGVGFDGYGDWYRSMRNLAAAERRGPDFVSNSAHNVFLDISSSGGLMLLIPYFLILIITLRSAYRLLRRQKAFDVVACALISLWFGYLAQSVISINQLGLVVWGWLLSGCIVGYEIHSSDSDGGVKSKSHAKLPASVLLGGFLFGTLGLLVSLFPVRQDIEFRNALVQGDGAALIKAAEMWPTNFYYLDKASDLLLQSNQNVEALELSRKSVLLNPRNYSGWRFIYENPLVGGEERAEALKRLRELDPYNPVFYR